MHHDGLEFHNVGELRAEDEYDGALIQRVPETVRTGLNEGAQRRMRHPAGVELRFVPEGEGTVELTLSTVPDNGVDEGVVRIFWGPFQGRRDFVPDDPEDVSSLSGVGSRGRREEYLVGEEPVTLELSVPERLTEIEPAVADDLAFHPQVCRVQLPGEHRGGFVQYHEIEGDVRPPRDDELPDRRYLAYGTSITEGESPLAEHLTYASQTARRLDADLLNLGSCGTAYCDPAMAEHIAGEEWDVATLALSVNMVGTFSLEEFRSRAAAMVETVADAHPDDPIACITLYPHASDVCGDEEAAERAEAFRDALREIVADSPHENVHLLEGTDMLPSIAGLTPDLVHPGDNAMITMGENLARELEALLSE
ncbi:GDSL-type esterase/lipase family protein [Halobacteria archaeon AArc-m2/3/4]|uniref:GDSL-type esterase/lipase family protein n=1 Tax=Natronoglomus mannanivorans TaxID=2979990 RepID=A0ABT2QK98_9EURY|nr:GDSL-type esterase/lipase family protein [Halobacteria archaeon AArc-m2/3/4]